MHEISLIQNLIEIASEHAQQHGASQVHTVVLRVGTSAGVDPDSLMFAFDVVCQGTRLEGAKLEIEEISTICFCSHCQKQFPADGWDYSCPDCGKVSTQIQQGQELELARVEVS